MRRIVLAACFALGAAVAVACVGSDTAPVDIAPDGGSASSTSSSGGTDGGPVVVTVCPDSCIAKAPDGWTGPSAVFVGNEAEAPTACPPELPQEDVRSTTLSATQPPTCDQCASNLKTTCVLTSEAYQSAGCVTSFGVGTIDSTTACKALVITGAMSYQLSAVVTNKDCPVNTETGPAAKAVDAVELACSAAAVQTCAADPSCVHTPLAAGFNKVCIWRAGDVDCPNADYAVKQAGMKDVTDTRACSPCTAKYAAGPDGTDCGSTIPVYPSFDCSGTPSDVKLDRTCNAEPAGTHGSIHPIPVVPTGSCVAAGGVESGALNAANPITYCCNK